MVAEDGLEAIAAAAGLAAAKRRRADDLRDLRLGELQLDALEQRDRVEIVLPRTSVVNGISIQSIVSLTIVNVRCCRRGDARRPCNHQTSARPRSVR